MILFMEKTWFLWWMLAIIVVVRWFHVLQTATELERFDGRTSTPQQAQPGSGEFSSPNAGRMFV